MKIQSWSKLKSYLENGIGYIYNDYGDYYGCPQYNKLHVANCRHLSKMNTSSVQWTHYFPTLKDATSWLDSNRPRRYTYCPCVPRGINVEDIPVFDENKTQIMAKETKQVDYQNILIAIDRFNTHITWCHQYETVLEVVKDKQIEKLVSVDVSKMFKFLRQWGVQGLNRVDIEEMLQTLRNIKSDLQALSGENIISIDFNQYGPHITRCFEQLHRVYGLGPTAVSKILHILNPDVFVMWDTYITQAYNVSRNASSYVESFLPLMQKLLKAALDKFAQDNGYTFSDAISIMILKANGRSLAKIIDEYNWLEFSTLKSS